MAIHQDQLSRYGGTQGMRDEGMLHSALAQPESSFDGVYLHPDLCSMAGAYLYHIIMNHPFIDGNKRTATVAALVFLNLNGHELEVEESLLEQVVLNVASGTTKKDELAIFFRTYTIEI